MYTHAYVDLMFAWGYARLGDVETARQLTAEAERLLRPTGDRAHAWLLDALEYRIGQAIAGQPHQGSLPSTLLEALDRIDEERSWAPSFRYVVDRARSLFEILEPDDLIDVYVQHFQNLSEPAEAVCRLLTGPSTENLEARFLDLQAKADTSLAAPHRRQFYFTALRCPRAIEAEVARHLIPAATGASAQLIQDLLPLASAASRTSEPLPGPWAPAKAGEALQSALSLFNSAVELAGRVRRADLVREQLDLFLGFQADLTASARSGPGIETAVRELGKALIRCDLGREATALLDRVSEEWTAEYRATADPAALQTCLALAGLDNWCERWERANRVLETARSEIHRLDKPAPRVQVTCAFLDAISHGPWAETITNLRAIIGDLQWVPNSFTTATHFSRLHLQVAERTVLAIASPNFGPPADVLRAMPPAEIASRREALAEVRGRLVEWSHPYWRSATKS